MSKKRKGFDPQIDVAVLRHLHDLVPVFSDMQDVLEDWDAYDANDPRADPDNDDKRDVSYMEAVEIKKNLQAKLAVFDNDREKAWIDVNRWNNILKKLDVTGIRREHCGEHSRVASAREARTICDTIISQPAMQVLLQLACELTPGKASAEGINDSLRAERGTFQEKEESQKNRKSQENGDRSP